MNEEKFPYRRMVFVCTNIREEDGRPACGLRGSEKICEMLKEEVKKRGLKGKIRALKSGCMDLCEKGPNVMVFPEGTYYSGVAPEDVPSFIERYFH
jgi:(2Fe-2S) ferredoxin